MSEIGIRRFRTRVAEDDRVEIFVAGGRIALASGVLASVWLAAQSVTSPHWVSGLIATAYWALSLGTLFAAVSGTRRWLTFAADAVDLLFPATIALFTGGTSSLFYPLYIWPVLTTTVRLGIKRAVLTVGIIMAVVIGELSLLSVEGLRTLVQADYDPLAFFLKGVCYLGLMAAIAYVTERQTRIQHAAMLVSKLVANSRADAGFTRSVQLNLVTVSRAFGAMQAMVVCKNSQNSRSVLLRVVRTQQEQKSTWQQTTSVYATQCLELFAASRETGTKPKVALVKRSQVQPWPLLLESGSKVLIGHIPDVPDWDVGVFLVDSRECGTTALRLLNKIIADVAPAMRGLYLVRQLRSRAKAWERSRLAHELHDGTLQSLFAMRLQLKALRRRHVLPAEVATDIDRVEQLLRSEMVQLRSLMQRMSDPAIEPGELVGTLAECVRKFERDSELHTTFTAQGPVNLPGSICRELVRITQEALTNIHRHSRARNVRVEFRGMQGICWLAIADDGVGFDFEGRLTTTDLSRLQKGPRMIRQRAESIGAHLVVTSTPGQGSCVELLLIATASSETAHA